MPPNFFVYEIIKRISREKGKTIQFKKNKVRGNIFPL